MKKTSPRISIVTPTYNQGQYIETTIQSIISQDYPNLEYIIIDGASTDNTVDIIKKYEKHLKYWVSEPDKGQSDAIMKGLQHCTGEIFNWINSDDYLAPNALKVIENEFSEEYDAIAGNVILFNNNSNEEIQVQQKNLTPTNLIHWSPGTEMTQPGIWLRRNKIVECGGINSDLHFAFDLELLIRYFYYYPRIKYINNTLVYFRLHENSKTVSQPDHFKNEEIGIAKLLSENKNIPGIRKSCLLRIKKHRWSIYLYEMMNSDSKPTYLKSLTILAKAIISPRIRLNRKTMGAIKFILLR